MARFLDTGQVHIQDSQSMAPFYLKVQNPIRIFKFLCPILLVSTVPMALPIVTTPEHLWYLHITTTAFINHRERINFLCLALVFCCLLCYLKIYTLSFPLGVVTFSHRLEIQEFKIKFSLCHEFCKTGYKLVFLWKLQVQWALSSPLLSYFMVFSSPYMDSVYKGWLVILYVISSHQIRSCSLSQRQWLEHTPWDII